MRRQRSHARADTPEPKLKLAVRTYNYAAVPGHILITGEEHAAEIFRRAGIELAWVDCPVSRGEIEEVSYLHTTDE